MAPLDEILSWSDARIEAEIARGVPEDSDFVCEWEDTHWSARIEVLSPTEPATVLHIVEHIDRRMALYAVYGYLWMKGKPPPEPGSAWDPSSSRPTVASVSEFVRSMVADPEDLNPEEVAAVYGFPSTKG